MKEAALAHEWRAVSPEVGRAGVALKVSFSPAATGVHGLPRELCNKSANETLLQRVKVHGKC